MAIILEFYNFLIQTEPLPFIDLADHFTHYHIHKISHMIHHVAIGQSDLTQVCLRGQVASINMKA